MARTWVVTQPKLRRLALLDFVGRAIMPILRVLLPPASRRPRVDRILVTELWHIGDVVLAVPFLSALRDVFPGAHITLLAKAHARDVLEASGLVDEIVTHDFPWTAPAGKYNPARYDLRRTMALFRELRRKRFDVAFDSRMDLRGHLVLYLSGAARRVGHAYGGGAYLLTDRIPVSSFDAHKSDDWLRLLTPFGGGPRTQRRGLAITPEERERARSLLADNGVTIGAETVVAVHPGASRDTKQWRLSGFASAARVAREEFDARVVQFVAPGDTGGLLQDAVPLTLPLRELMAALSLCDLLICNDSGPMHLAAALGVPVVAIFGSGTKEWYGPLGAGHRLVDAPVECRPCFAECRFAEIFCLSRVDVDRVVDAVRAQLSERRADAAVRG